MYVVFEHAYDSVTEYISPGGDNFYEDSTFKFVDSEFNSDSE